MGAAYGAEFKTDMLTYACPVCGEATYICYYRTNSQILDADRARKSGMKRAANCEPTTPKCMLRFPAFFMLRCAVDVGAN